MRQKLRKLCMIGLLVTITVSGFGLTVFAEEAEIKVVGEPLALPEMDNISEIDEAEEIVTTSTEDIDIESGVVEEEDVVEAPIGGMEPLFATPNANKRAAVENYPISITANISTNQNYSWTFYANQPEVTTLIDKNGYVNVVYLDGEKLKIQRYNSAMTLVDTILLPKRYALYGNTTCDPYGNYYVVWGQIDSEMTDENVVMVTKYDYSGNFKSEFVESASESAGSFGSDFCTKIPFNAGNCSIAFNNGVLAINYAREMYSGHQSNRIFYVQASDMTRLGGYEFYNSHSFDQRIIPLSDGGFFAASHGDAFYRSFAVTRINSARNNLGNENIIHFREGGNRDHGYNETYAEMGGIIETNNALVFCGCSEKTLSLDVAPTGGVYCGHSEARNLYVQILKKNFYEFSGSSMYKVAGVSRTPVGTKPSSALTALYLNGSERDYGVLWLTNYPDTEYVSNPKIVSIGNGKFAILWEKRLYASRETVHSYYAVVNENGGVVTQPVEIPGVRMAADADPAYQGGKIYWTTKDTSGAVLHVLDVNQDAPEWIKVSGISMQENLTLKVGETATLTPTVLPSNAYTKGIIYSTERVSGSWGAIDLDDNGKITARNAGVYRVIVTSMENSNISASCTVTVVQPVTKLTLRDTTLNTKVGNRLSLSLSREPYDATNPSIEWSVSPADSLEILEESNYYFMFVAKKKGATTITAKTKDGSNISVSCKVTIEPKYYSVTFYTNGGDDWEEEERNIEEGTPIGKLPIPKKSGYIFDGWCEGYNTNYLKEDTLIYRDTYLNAHWSYDYNASNGGDSSGGNSGSGSSGGNSSSNDTPPVAQTPEEKVNAFVERMYTVALGRKSDKNGKADWVNKLINKERDGAGIAQGFLMSKEFLGKGLDNEAYVDVLYRTFFDRAGDEGGKKYWMDKLASGTTRQFVLAGFVNSKEFTKLCDSFGIVRGTFAGGAEKGDATESFVLRLYSKVLGRNGDANGVKDWVSRIKNKVQTPEEVAKGFFGSKEFIKKGLSNEAYVDVLYQTFMDRAADKAGKADWVSKLNAGTDRTAVLEGFSRSKEFKKIMESFGL